MGTLRKGAVFPLRLLNRNHIESSKESLPEEESKTGKQNQKVEKDLTQLFLQLNSKMPFLNF